MEILQLIEISREYVQHFNDKYRRDATDELTMILDSYNIHYKITGKLPKMAVTLEAPQTLMPWKPLACFAGIVALLYFLSRDKE